MLVSRKKYFELINKPTPLTPEEQKQVEEFENTLISIQENKEYAPDPAFRISQTYKEQIDFLNNVKSLNPNQQGALDRSASILELSSRKEQKKEQGQRLVLKQEKQYQRAGYMNATILIFVVFNFAFLIAALLLIAR